MKESVGKMVCIRFYMKDGMTLLVVIILFHVGVQ